MILKKSAISLAVAAGLAMTGVAQAGDLILDLNGKVPTFATHIFGDGAGNGNDSSGQAIYSPDLIYSVDTPTGVMIAGGTVEIRFNLGNGAVFADTITDAHFVYDQGGVGATLANETVAGLFTIVGGGQIGDFDVTVRVDTTLLVVTPNTMTTLDEVRLAMSTGAVDGGVAGAYTQDIALNIEYSNVMHLGTAGSTVEASVSIQGGEDPTDEETIAISADPLIIVGSAASASGEAANTINMSDADILFSTGNDGATDGLIDGSDSLEAGQEENTLGSLSLDVTTSSHTWDEQAQIAAATVTTQISDPAGDQYAPDGADDVTLTITTNVTAGLSPLDSAGGLELGTVAGGACTGVVATDTGLVGTDTAVFDFSSYVDGSFRSLCAVTDGAAAVQPQTFTATIQYENFEPTYRDDVYTATLAAWERNGCTATFFNVTKNNNNDETYLRITNATDASAPVRVRVWGQDGTLLGENGALLESSLAAHETKVYTPSDIQAAVGTGEWTGRARVVAFVGANSCVGQNLVRSGGININMTATTDANDGSYVDYDSGSVLDVYGSSNSGN